LHIRNGQLTPEYRAYPLGAWGQMYLLAAGWLLREPRGWIKSRPNAAAYSTATAIGGPRDPPLRPYHELVLVGSKDPYLLPGKDPTRWPGDAAACGGCLEWCKDVWFIAPGRTQAGEPLAFPDERVSRLVVLYSAPGDIVLDPFLGNGTTCRVAHARGRAAIGFDIRPAYVERVRAALGAAAREGPLGQEGSA